MNLRLHLVRHGATEWSDAGRLTGWNDVPLNERGRGQARAMKRRLEHARFDGVWSSDLARAVQTAEIIAPNFQTDTRLREIDLGELEGKLWDECPIVYQEALLDFDSFHAPGGESTEVLGLRVRSFLDDLSAGCHLVVTHGGLIRYLLRATDRDSAVGPGEMVRVDWVDDRN